MQINIEPDSSYLFRPYNLRGFVDTLQEILAEENEDRASMHHQRLYQVLDMIEALTQAVDAARKTAKEAAR
jgi:hypothetical protein